MEEATAMTDDTRARAAAELIERAKQEVFAICKGRHGGGHEWRMSIPVNEERDSDVIIMAGLNALADAVAQAVRKQERIFQSEYNDLADAFQGEYNDLADALHRADEEIARLRAGQRYCDLLHVHESECFVNPLVQAAVSAERERCIDIVNGCLFHGDTSVWTIRAANQALRVAVEALRVPVQP